MFLLAPDWDAKGRSSLTWNKVLLSDMTGSVRRRDNERWNCGETARRQSIAALIAGLIVNVALSLVTDVGMRDRRFAAAAAANERYAVGTRRRLSDPVCRDQRLRGRQIRPSIGRCNTHISGLASVWCWPRLVLSRRGIKRSVRTGLRWLSLWWRYRRVGSEGSCARCRQAIPMVVNLTNASLRDSC